MKKLIYMVIFILMMTFVSAQTNIPLNWIINQVNGSSVDQNDNGIIDIAESGVSSMSNITLGDVASNMGNWSADKPNYYTITSVNNIVAGQSNLTIQQIVVNTGNWSADRSGLVNLTIVQVSASIGNWSADRNGLVNLTIQQVVSGVGNWSQDRSGLVNLTLVQVTSSIGNWSADRSGLVNLTLVQVTSSIGNWSADKPSYYTASQVNTIISNQNNYSADTLISSIGNWSSDRPNYINTTRWSSIISTYINTTALSAYNITVWTGINNSVPYVGAYRQIFLGAQNLTIQNTKGANVTLNNFVEHTQEMQSNTLLDRSRSQLSCVNSQLNYTLIAVFGCGQFNFNGTLYPASGTTCVTNATLTLTCGTNTTPITNYVYWELQGGVPTFLTSPSYPSTDHIDVATWVVGACSGSNYTIYSYNRNRYEVDTFVTRVLERFEKSGTLYTGGFDTTANTTNININTGSFINGILAMNTANNVSTHKGFYYINSSGNYVQATSLASLTQYADGTAFSGINERVNIVWGVVPVTVTAAGTAPTTGRLVAILPNYPGAGNTYQTVANAIADAYGTTNYFPPTVVKNSFTPIARTILRPNSDVLEPFFGTTYYSFIAGKITSGGSSPSSSTTNHNELNNLDYTTAGHTGFTSSIEFLELNNTVYSLSNWSRDRPNYINSTVLNGILGNYINMTSLNTILGAYVNMTTLEPILGNYINSSVWSANGNWSADRSGMNNLSTTDVINIMGANGNWSADRSGMNNLSMLNINSSQGNWSLDKSGYTKTGQDTNYVAVTGDSMTGELNMTYQNVTSLDCVIGKTGGRICFI